jgi:hypothetical protein
LRDCLENRNDAPFRSIVRRKHPIVKILFVQSYICLDKRLGKGAAADLAPPSGLAFRSQIVSWAALKSAISLGNPLILPIA